MINRMTWVRIVHAIKPTKRMKWRPASSCFNIESVEWDEISAGDCNEISDREADMAFMKET